MERGMSSAEGGGTVTGGSAAEDEMDEMRFSGGSRSTWRTRRSNVPGVSPFCRRATRTHPPSRALRPTSSDVCPLFPPCRSRRNVRSQDGGGADQAVARRAPGGVPHVPRRPFRLVRRECLERRRRERRPERRVHRHRARGERRTGARGRGRGGGAADGRADVPRGGVNQGAHSRARLDSF